MFRNKFVRIATLMGCSMLFMACGDNRSVSSPDGRTKIDFSISEAGELSYSVERDGKPFIDASRLGLVAEECNLNSGFEINAVEHSSKNEEWEQPWGENKQMRDHHNEMVVRLKGQNDVELAVRFRAFDDGYGFRYEYACGREDDKVTVTDELTEFRLAENGASWSIPGSFETYELQYRNLPIAEVEDANTPFTFRTESGVFGSVHEAALYDFPEMVLRRDKNGVLKSDLAPLPDTQKAHVPSTFHTAWRTMQLGDKAVDLINSSLILNLNEPSKIADTDWIKPHKYVGVWWGMHLGTQTWVMGKRHGATTENALRHIDFAAENNIQGVLFEGWNRGWENWGGSQSFDYMQAYPDFDVERIARYAKEKGIELWMHNETGGNIPEYESVMDEAMAKYASWGVHTLKTGYAGGFKGGYLHHSQYGVKHYQKVVETAARHQLMIDAHEPIKETGIRRTWPNMMTREGARGMEWNAWSEGNSADYLCVLPYVRLLGGPMDYTPGIFDIDYSRARADKGRIMWNGDNTHCCIKTTLARQMANWVIIYSPLQMAADLIENYEGNPAFQFFRDFDADCDWSKAIAGEIGEYIAVVRRADDNYFLGVGTNHEARTLSLPLDFLKEGVSYEAVVYADDTTRDDPEAYIIEKRRVTSADTLEVAMAAKGGAAVSFMEVED